MVFTEYAAGIIPAASNSQTLSMAIKIFLNGC